MDPPSRRRPWNLDREAEAKDVRASDHPFPGGSAWLEHKFLEVLGLTPWRHCRWHSLRRGGRLRVTLATPKCSSSSGGGDGAVSALPCGMRQLPRRYRRGPSSIALGSRGGWGDQGAHTLGGLGSLYVPRRGRAPASSRVPPLTTCRTPPPPPGLRPLGGGSSGKLGVASSSAPPPAPLCPAPPGP